MSRAREERAALRAETTRLLNDLGGSADAVATNLESTGVKGVPGSGTGCAIARYVNAVMASDARLGPITVSNEAVTILGRHWWTPPVIVPVPLPVRSFIVRFDREDFVSLTAAPPGARRGPGPAPVDHAANRDDAHT